MSRTERLGLPHILQAQAQKEVTHNQALTKLDVFVMPIVETITNIPPTNATGGNIYIVGTSPEGIFSDHANDLAQYSGGSWTFYTPITWMDVTLKETQSRMIYNGNSWVSYGLITKDTGEYLRVEHWQEDVQLLGKTVATSQVLPDRSSVMAVNIRVLEAVTGVPSFAIGVKDDPSRYGDKIGIAKDTTNIGMSYHPVTYYSNTPVMLTPNEMEFTGGVVRVTAQYFKPRGPWTW